MIAYVSTWGNGQEVRLSTEVLDTLRERVLCILDGVVGDLLDLGDTSSKHGHAAVKKALRIDAENSPTSSKARTLEEAIIEGMIAIYRQASVLQERFARGESSFSVRPPAAADHIKRLVANNTGVSISQVDATWRKYLSEGEHADDCKALIQQVKEQDKALRRKVVPKLKAAVKRPQKPTADHRWRRTVRTKI